MIVPQVSIVVPNFNKASFIGQTISSLIAQGKLAETIVVDDCSADDSVSIIERAERECPSIRLVRAPQRLGGSGCRNLGLSVARGEYVMFVDSDDLLSEWCCNGRLEAARAMPDHDMWVFPMSVFRDRPGAPVDQWVPQRGDHLRHFLAHRLDWHTMQPLWRTSFVRAIGGFDPAFPRLQDPEVHTKALLQGARVALFPDMPPDCHYRIAAERHEADASGLAERHVVGSILFYERFAPQVRPERLPLLSGTLLACQGMLLQWWRTGRLDPATLDAMNARLLDTCRVRWHVPVLAWSFKAQRLSPTHLPGLRWATKRLLGLP
jgi:GT2 family glycosyltransferase